MDLATDTPERSPIAASGAWPKRPDQQLQERCSMLERELEKAQQLVALGQLAAGVAHEINTPMQYIGDNTRFLHVTVQRLLDLGLAFEELVRSCRQGGPTTTELDRHEQELKKCRLSFLREHAPLAIEQSTSGVDQVRTIVQALKEFSHPGHDEPVLLDVNRLAQVATTVTRNAWRYHAEVSFELAEILPPVSGNPQALGQVLINLIVNAADAIESQSAVSGVARPGRIVIRSCVRADCVELQLEDNGIGIPDAIRERVMEPFFTTKGVGKGTGQGLALAYSTIVEKHAGKFFFQSQLGRGTTFFIQLPIGEGEA